MPSEEIEVNSNQRKKVVRTREATASLIFGLVGLVIFRPILGIFAIIFGIKALKTINNPSRIFQFKGKVLAIVGIALGVLSCLDEITRLWWL